MTTELTWLGHSAFRLDSPGGKRIYVDPFLNGNPKCPESELEDGFKIYFSGDTNVFGDMSLIGRIYSPDVAVLPIGDHYTMGPREAAVAIELLGVVRCVPCHYGTFPLLTGTPESLRKLVSAGVEILSPKPGETLSF